MNRIEFMTELAALLQDVPAEERRDAMKFYNDYFDDAGEENEQQVIAELGDPAQVAATIKADLGGASKEHGEFTEKGYTDSRFENKDVPVGREYKESGQKSEGYGYRNTEQSRREYDYHGYGYERSGDSGRYSGCGRNSDYDSRCGIHDLGIVLHAGDCVGCDRVRRCVCIHSGAGESGAGDRGRSGADRNGADPYRCGRSAYCGKRKGMYDRPSGDMQRIRVDRKPAVSEKGGGVDEKRMEDILDRVRLSSGAWPGMLRDCIWNGGYNRYDT